MAEYKFPGMMKKVVNKKEMEEQRKRVDEAAAAKAFEEYVAEFQETQGGARALNKTWVKAGVYEAGKKHEESKEKGKLYKPTSRFEREPILPSLDSQEDMRPERLGKKKEKEKRKSNLEIFKDELKLIQEEREERHRLKTVLGLQELKLPPKAGDSLRASLSLELDDSRMGSIDDGDPNTTNIYLGNLPTKVSEQELMALFGRFGPLASVKVMWPRTEEEKARNRLSGFVAFMSRRDGERALKTLGGKEILGAEVKLGWGKAVPIPAFPIYIPPQMLELSMPPPLSGLPFNAQPAKRDKHKIPPLGTPYPTDLKGQQEFERVLSGGTVKVVAPTDRGLLALVHRMVEFVAREGPMFEAMVMNREINNPAYRFLFENQSPAHVYYRWKLFSILQGEAVQRWRIEEFRMFKGGSIWKPPMLSPFKQGMPEELIPEEERDFSKGSLSNAQRDRLERMLRGIKPDKYRVAEVMIFSIEHAESAEEIAQTLRESLSNPKTPLPKKVARLFVISDILHNCTTKGMSATPYRNCLKTQLPGIFQELHYAYSVQQTENSGSSGAESFKQRVMACFRAWEEAEIFPKEFLIRLQNIFLGLATVASTEVESIGEEEQEAVVEVKKKRRSPPRATMPPKSALNLVRVMQATEPGLGDLDGVPLEDMDGEPLVEDPPPPIEEKKPKGAFVPSKWETIDPEEVKAQAVTTTSKWDLFEEGMSLTNEKDTEGIREDEDLDGVPLEDDPSPDMDGRLPFDEEDAGEEWRQKLREVENKVLLFQDELESGRRKLRDGESLSALLHHYRQSLLRKLERDRGLVRKDEERLRRSENNDKESQHEPKRTKERQKEPRSERDRESNRYERDSKSERERRHEREPRSEREGNRYDREPRSERDSGRYEKEPRSDRDKRRESRRGDDDGDSSGSWKRKHSPSPYSDDERSARRKEKRSSSPHRQNSRNGSPRRRDRSKNSPRRTHRHKDKH